MVSDNFQADYLVIFCLGKKMENPVRKKEGKRIKTIQMRNDGIRGKRLK